MHAGFLREYATSTLTPTNRPSRVTGIWKSRHSTIGFFLVFWVLSPTILISDSLKMINIKFSSKELYPIFSPNCIFIFLRVYHLANSCRTTHDSAPRSVMRDVWPWNPAQYYVIYVGHGYSVRCLKRYRLLLHDVSGKLKHSLRS